MVRLIDYLLGLGKRAKANTDGRFVEAVTHSLPTSNSRPAVRRRRLKPFIRSLKARQPASHGNGERLYARVTYFNKAGFHSKQDIQNVLKPLFDSMEGFIYINDKQICEYSGTRADMNYRSIWFDLECDITEAPNVDWATLLNSGGYLVDVGVLPTSTVPLVKVKWLEV